jgi:small subunit ribosomal protein S17
MEKQHRQEKTGVVSSTGMDKTIVVVVENTFVHPTYKRVVRQKRKFKAHDERNECNVNDLVRIVETRPLSRTKRWRLAEIIERAK